MWIQFILSASVIVFAGFFLTKYGDEISEKSSISGGFVGFFLLALATSLPELITSISAVAISKAPELSLGNIFGSNLFNIAIIVILDLLSRSGAFAKSDEENVISIAYIYVMSIIVLIPITLNCFYGYKMFTGIPINIESVILLLVYIYILRSFKAKEDSEKDNSLPLNNKNGLAKVYMKFAFMSLLIVVAGIFVTSSVDAIAEKYELGKTFAGSLLLAFVTSLPEATVSISAIKIGAINMAIGNVLGSNVFNLLIVFFADIFTKKQLLYLPELKSSVVTGVFSLLIAALALIGIENRSVKSKFLFYRLSIPGFLILVIYLSGMYLTYIIK